jgi:hypothetical protein
MPTCCYTEGTDKAAVRKARCTLLQACKHALSEERSMQAVDAESASNLLSVLPDRVKSVMLAFLDHGFPQPVHVSLASFLKLLACDAPVSDYCLTDIYLISEQ